jgi:hypothetical protein
MYRRIYMQLIARVHVQNVPGGKVSILGVHSNSKQYIVKVTRTS